MDEVFLKEFLEDRKNLLMNLDLNEARKYCEKYKIKYHESDDIMLIGLHKARANALDIPEDKREESKKWLAESGYSIKLGR